MSCELHNETTEGDAKYADICVILAGKHFIIKHHIRS